MDEYSKTMSNVYDCGTIQPGRGIPTVSMKGTVTRHDCGECHPIVTIKHQGHKSQTAEFVWMMKAFSNNNWLLDNGCTVWNDFDVIKRPIGDIEDDIIAEFAKIGVKVTIGQNNEVVDLEKIYDIAERLGVRTGSGRLGPVYGEMLGNWPTSKGGKINQLKELIANMRTDPFSRRHVLSMWNPEFVPDEAQSHEANILNGKQVLPPCHMVIQLLVRTEPRFKHLLLELSEDLDPNDEELIFKKTYVGNFEVLKYSDVQCAKVIYEKLSTGGYTDLDFTDWVDEMVKSSTFFIKMAELFSGKELNDSLIEKLNAMYDCRKVDLIYYMRSNDKPYGEPYNDAFYGTMLAAVAHLLGYERGELIHMTGDSHIYINQLDGVETMLNREEVVCNPQLTIKNRGQTELEHFEIDDFILTGYESGGKLDFGKLNV